MGYAMMGHLIFGTVITQFKTFPEAITTCLEIIMGDPSINTQLRQLPGLMVRPPPSPPPSPTPSYTCNDQPCSPCICPCIWLL